MPNHHATTRHSIVVCVA